MVDTIVPDSPLAHFFHFANLSRRNLVRSGLGFCNNRAGKIIAAFKTMNSKELSYSNANSSLLVEPSFHYPYCVMNYYIGDFRPLVGHQLQELQD